MIYFIDDDESTRAAFDLLLESLGLGFESFESVEEFLSGIKITKSDLLILDLNLPGMSGLDLLKKFSQEKKYIPVIIVTALDDVQSRECCMQYGVKAYLRKPVDGKVLIDLINSCTLSLCHRENERV
jgi:FixJ family two-component response regulator